MYGLQWNVLAAVGALVSDQGSPVLPGVRSGTSGQGAAGLAQFTPRTWARYGTDADGDGRISPYAPADAIASMAAYLKASGAPQDWKAALFAYHHSHAWVARVLSLSQRYAR
jgi:hypothetical protein